MWFLETPHLSPSEPALYPYCMAVISFSHDSPCMLIPVSPILGSDLGTSTQPTGELSRRLEWPRHTVVNPDGY